jgi:hypothetical protein
LAAAALVASILMLGRRLHGLVDQPFNVASQIVGGGAATSALPALNGITRAWSPAVAACLISPRTRRTAALVLLVSALGDWAIERGGLDPVRYSALHVADDLAYGTGVWLGCLRAKTIAPLLPRVAFRARVWSDRSLRAQPARQPER